MTWIANMRRAAGLLAGRVADWWDRRREGAAVYALGPVANAMFFTMTFMGMVRTPSGAEPAAGPAPWNMAPDARTAAVAYFAAGLVSTLVLLFRRSRPLTALLVECAICLAALPLDSAYNMLLPVVMASYSCASRAAAPRMVAGVLASTAVFAAQSLWTCRFDWSPETARAVLAAQLANVLVVGAALHSRYRRERARLERQRDAAVRRSRIAAELHDSVGHDLTAIIALSDGLGGTGDDALDEGLSTINDLAREGLADTRRAVRALSAAGRRGDAAGGCGVCGD